MRTWLGATVMVGLAASAASSATAQEMKADVVHVWTAAGERGAAKVLADEFTALGGTWVDVAVAGSGGPLRTTVNQILAGDPPSASQFSSSRDHVDLIDKGELTPIDAVAEENDWVDVLSEPMLDAIKVDGHYYLAPVGVHTPNWIWYNKEVLAKAGVEPPTNLDETIFDSFDKIQQAGFIPFAVSGQPSQLRFVFEGFLIGMGGQEMWNAVWRDKDPDVLRGDEMKKVFETFKRLRDYADDGWSGRAWNPTINMVISGQAAYDVLGDWAKAEFYAAGKTLGTDFDCVLTGNTMIIHADFMGFPTQVDKSKVPAQMMLAKMILDPQVQVDFSRAKGAIPPRTDVDISGLDKCAQTAAAAYRDPARVVGNARTYLNPPAVGDYMDLLTEYFDAPDMSSDEAVERFADIVENGL